MSKQLSFEDLTGGINNVDTKGNLNSSTKKTQTPDMVNIEYFQLGGIKSMEGNTQIGDTQDTAIVGGWEYIQGKKRYMMIGTKDGHVKIYNNVTNTFDEVYKFPSQSDRMSFCNMNNGVVVTNGKDDLFFYDKGNIKKLNGVVSVNNNYIYGVGTYFKSDLSVGDYIEVDRYSGIYKVEKIINNTTLQVDRKIEKIPGCKYYGFKGTKTNYRVITTNDVNLNVINKGLTFDESININGVYALNQVTTYIDNPIQACGIQYGRLFIEDKVLLSDVSFFKVTMNYATGSTSTGIHKLYYWDYDYSNNKIRAELISDTSYWSDVQGLLAIQSNRLFKLDGTNSAPVMIDDTINWKALIPVNFAKQFNWNTGYKRDVNNLNDTILQNCYQYAIDNNNKLYAINLSNNTISQVLLNGTQVTVGSVNDFCGRSFDGEYNYIVGSSQIAKKCNMKMIGCSSDKNTLYSIEGTTATTIDVSSNGGIKYLCGSYIYDRYTNNTGSNTRHTFNGYIVYNNEPTKVYRTSGSAGSSGIDLEITINNIFGSYYSYFTGQTDVGSSRYVGFAYNSENDITYYINPNISTAASTQPTLVCKYCNGECYGKARVRAVLTSDYTYYYDCNLNRLVKDDIYGYKLQNISGITSSDPGTAVDVIYEDSMIVYDDNGNYYKRISDFNLTGDIYITPAPTHYQISITISTSNNEISYTTRLENHDIKVYSEPNNSSEIIGLEDVSLYNNVLSYNAFNNTVSGLFTGECSTLYRKQSEDVVNEDEYYDSYLNLDIYKSDKSLLNATLVNTDGEGGSSQLNVPIRGLAIQYFKGRLWVGGEKGLFYSAVGLPNNWDINSDAGVFYDVYNDNSPVTALGLFSDFMTIHKQFNTYLLTDSGSNEAESAMQITPFSNITCKSQQSWIVSNTKYFVYSDDFNDIYPLVQHTVWNDRFLGEPISQKIRNLFNNIRLYDTEKIFCVSRPTARQMIFYMPTNSHAGSNHAVIYDFQTKSWLLRIVPQDVTIAFNYNNNIYIGTNDGKVLKEFTGKSFDGEPINSYYKSPWFDWIGGYIQSFAEFEIEIDNNTNNKFYIKAYKDGKNNKKKNNIDITNREFDATKIAPTNCLIWSGVSENSTTWDNNKWAQDSFDNIRMLLPNNVFEDFQFEIGTNKLGQSFKIYGYKFRRIEAEEAPW